jgi:hypothetical protein
LHKEVKVNDEEEGFFWNWYWVKWHYY